MKQENESIKTALEHIFYIATYTGLNICEEKEITHWRGNFLKLNTTQAR